MLPSLRGSPVAIVNADDFLGTGFSSPDRSYSPDPGASLKAKASAAMRSSIAVSWSDYPKEQQTAVDMRLPSLSRPTSRQVSQHHSPSTIGAGGQRSREPPMNSSTSSSLYDGEYQRVDTEVRRATTSYNPAGDQLKIMRLAKVGASPLNANPKLTRLAAMMDQFKLNEYVRIDPPTISRPVSRHETNSSTPFGSIAARSYTGSTLSVEEQSLSSHRTFSPSNNSPPSSVLEQPRHSPLHNLHGQSPSKPLPPIPSRDTTPPPAAQLRIEDEAQQHPLQSSSPTHQHQQLSKEEDYWRGYLELEEGQRRYYLWTFLRRGEMPLASQTFQVGQSPTVSHQTVAVDIARRQLGVPTDAQVRPNSATTTSLADRFRLPQRPASGALVGAAGRVHNVPPLTDKVQSRTVPAPYLTSADVALPMVIGHASPLRSPPTVSILATSNASTEPHLLLSSPTHRGSNVISPMSNPSLTSPRGALAREITRRFHEAVDDLEDDELFERNATEAKEEQNWSKLIVVPWLIKVTPLQEASCRKDLARIQQDVFFHLVSSTSRYLYLMERFYVEGRSAKLTLFDHGLAHWQRRVHQRLDVENDETHSRAQLIEQEAHVTRCLLRRWHQHAQVMLLRSKAYHTAMHTFSGMSTLAAQECYAREVVASTCDAVGVLVATLQRHESERLQWASASVDDMRVWFAESCGATRRQTRLLQEIAASMVALEGAEQLRRETLSRVGLEELSARHALQQSIHAILETVHNASTHHLSCLSNALDAESAHTSAFVQHYQQILHPERTTRRLEEHREEHLWDQMLQIDEMTRWRASQLQFFVRQATMDFSSSSNLFAAMIDILTEEYHAREKVLDLEDEAYEDDFIICVQRMRRLDTVRSFIIASPGQERRNRLSVEAEYREGLYELMELNDEIVQITRAAEGLANTKWHMYVAEEQFTAMQVSVVLPEAHGRQHVNEQSSFDYAALCTETLSRMVAWEAAMIAECDAFQHAVEAMYARDALSLQSSSELTVTESKVRDGLERTAAVEWLRHAAHVRILQLSDLESIQRDHIASAEDARVYPMWKAHRHVASLDVTATKCLRTVEGKYDDVALEVGFVAAATNVVGAHRVLLHTLSENRGALPFHREVCVAALRKEMESELALATSCGIPATVLANSIWAIEEEHWGILVRAEGALRELTNALDAARNEQQEMFDEYTTTMRRLMLPTVERVYRQRVTMSEKSQWKRLLKTHDAFRSTYTPAIQQLLLDHKEAVRICTEAAHADHHKALLKVGEEMQEAEVRRREAWEKREDDHRDVMRSVQRSLRWNVVILQQHHNAVAAALQGEHGNASNRSQFGDDEVSARSSFEANEKKVRAELVGIFHALTKQHYANDRAWRAAHEDLYDRVATQLLDYLKSLHDHHPADLAEKAPYMLTNDPQCTTLDFSTFHRNGNRCSDDTIDAVAALLRHTKHVEHLILSHNATEEHGGKLSKRGITTLTTMFYQLTRLELRNCKIGDEEAKMVLKALDGLQDATLEALVLDDNRITADGCKQLLTSLRSANSTLVDVTITGNEAVPKGMMSVVAFYCQLNRQSPALKTHVLRIEENDPAITFWSARTLQLTDEHVKLICVALFQNTHITHVDLEEHPQLTDASCHSIASMLRGNASISRIDLSGSSITDVGLQQLEHVLKQQPYRQPLMFKDLFGAPAAQLLRRRSSRFLTRSLSADSPQKVLQANTPNIAVEENSAFTSFTLSIHRTRISDKKYLACVLSMNELERAMVEMDEDDAYEVLMQSFFHVRDLVEDEQFAIQEISDTYDATEAIQHKYFVERVFNPLEGSKRSQIASNEDGAFRVLMAYSAFMVDSQRMYDVAHSELSLFHQRQVQLAIAALRMREWEPNHQQRIALEEIWVPEHKARKDVEEQYTILTHNTVERYHKYFLGSWKFFEKCLAAKQQALEKHSRDAKSLARKQSVFSLSALGRQNDSDVSEANFIPMELDPKQHQALAHLGNQPWELQGKGLAIAQNDPAVTALDISFAGVANKEEPPCSQDTIAVLFTLAKQNTCLQEVNLSGNPGAITGRCAPLLAKLAVRLKTLNIADCNVSEADVLPHILGALTQPSVRLETLIMDGNSITAQGAAQICRALRANISVSTVSLLRAPQPIPKVSLDFIQFYTDVNKLPKAYRTLIRRLESNDATCTEADFTNTAVLTGALRPHQNDVSSAAGCDSDDDAVSPYGHEREERNTALDDAAIKLVCIAMSRNMVLEKLLLAGNHITDRGVKFLAHIMQSSPSLKVVDLSQNKFTDAGAALLLKAAEKNAQLQDIRISTNDGTVGVHSRRMLLAQLQKNKS